MRRSPLRDLLAERGAVFEVRAGVEVPMHFGDVEAEYRAVREGVAITDFSFAYRFEVPEEGLDLLERFVAGPVPNIRFGRVLHTLAADEQGLIESDVYVANDDEKLIVVAETLVEDEAMAARLGGLGADEAGLQVINDSTALIGIDGFQAWAVARELLGADVLGLPYLSVESYEIEGTPIKLLRAGKTSEFGYLLLVPAADAAKVWQAIERAGEPHGIRPAGLQTHFDLRLDGRFFNVHREGAAVRDPLPLGLQWMIDFDAEEFTGREAIVARRSAGVAKKIIGVAAAPGGALEAGDGIVHDGEKIAEVVTASFSPTLGHRIGLALFDVAYGFAGLQFEREDGAPLRTISMPPFIPKSLTVKLDEM